MTLAECHVGQLVRLKSGGPVLVQYVGVEFVACGPSDGIWRFHRPAMLEPVEHTERGEAK